MTGSTRRQLLARIGASVPVLGLVSRRSAAQRSGFDPSVHGFGFDNWASGELPEHGHDPVSREAVRERIRTQWTDAYREATGVDLTTASRTFVDLLSTQLRATVNSLSASNGHCYGMTFAAQQYYERPETIPLGGRRASDIATPTAPQSDPNAEPVAETIDRFQSSQLLDVRSWIGRRAMANPAWISTASHLDALTSVLDEYGTCGLTLFDTKTKSSHQVLAYGRTERRGSVDVDIYDPNNAARWYAAGGSRTLRVRTEGGERVMRPYVGGYDTFVVNRYDRAILAADGFTPMRDARETETFRRALTRGVGFFVDTEDVELVVTDDENRPLGSLSATYADESRATYPKMAYEYGASPGTYHATVTGRASTSYTMRVAAATVEEPLVSETVEAETSPGTVHTYEVTVGETEDEGAVRQTCDRAFREGAAVGGVGGAAGAVGLAALYRRHRSG